MISLTFIQWDVICKNNLWLQNTEAFFRTCTERWISMKCYFCSLQLRCSSHIFTFLLDLGLWTIWADFYKTGQFVGNNQVVHSEKIDTHNRTQIKCFCLTTCLDRYDDNSRPHQTRHIICLYCVLFALIWAIMPALRSHTVTCYHLCAPQRWGEPHSLLFSLWNIKRALSFFHSTIRKERQRGEGEIILTDTQTERERREKGPLSLMHLLKHTDIKKAQRSVPGKKQRQQSKKLHGLAEKRGRHSDKDRVKKGKERVRACMKS